MLVSSAVGSCVAIFPTESFLFDNKPSSAYCNQHQVPPAASIIFQSVHVEWQPTGGPKDRSMRDCGSQKRLVCLSGKLQLTIHCTTTAAGYLFVCDAFVLQRKNG